MGHSGVYLPCKVRLQERVRQTLASPPWAKGVSYSLSCPIGKEGAPRLAAASPDQLYKIAERLLDASTLDDVFSDR